MAKIKVACFFLGHGVYIVYIYYMYSMRADRMPPRTQKLQATTVSALLYTT